MNGMNTLFMNDPVWFLQNICVDNQAMQLGGAGALTLTRLNAAKVGQFDLVLSGSAGANKVVLTDASIGSGHVIARDAPIPAYWCPFLPGGGLPGWVDVPRASPPLRFIFTAAMQGCAYAVTSSPAGAGFFRVFHNQHPTTASTWQAITQAGANVLSTLTYDQYGGGGLTNAFNILWRPPRKAWSYVSQTNRFVPSAPPRGVRNYRPVIGIERDLTKPILDLPAGV